MAVKSQSLFQLEVPRIEAVSRASPAFWETLSILLRKAMARKPNTETSTANIGFEAKLWLTADTATRARAKPKSRSHSAGLLRSERQLLANPPFNDSDWFRKDDDVRFFSLSASIPFSASDGEKVAEGRMRCLRESGERAGVRCRKFCPPPKGNTNFAWMQHFIHHLAPDGNIDGRQTLN